MGLELTRLVRYRNYRLTKYKLPYRQYIKINLRKLGSISRGNSSKEYLGNNFPDFIMKIFSFSSASWSLLKGWFSSELIVKTKLKLNTVSRFKTI
jgi:hypothetical protein